MNIKLSQQYCIQVYSPSYRTGVSSDIISVTSFFHMLKKLNDAL